MYTSNSRNVYMYANNCQGAFLNNDERCWPTQRIELNDIPLRRSPIDKIRFRLHHVLFWRVSKTWLFTSKKYNWKLCTLLDLLWERSTSLNNDKRCWSAERIKRTCHPSGRPINKFRVGFHHVLFWWVFNSLLFATKHTSWNYWHFSI